MPHNTSANVIANFTWFLFITHFDKFYLMVHDRFGLPDWDIATFECNTLQGELPDVFNEFTKDHRQHIVDLSQSKGFLYNAVTVTLGDQLRNFVVMAN